MIFQNRTFFLSTFFFAFLLGLKIPEAASFYSHETQQSLEVARNILEQAILKKPAQFFCLHQEEKFRKELREKFPSVRVKNGFFEVEGLLAKEKRDLAVLLDSFRTKCQEKSLLKSAIVKEKNSSGLEITRNLIKEYHQQNTELKILSEVKKILEGEEKELGALASSDSLLFPFKIYTSVEYSSLAALGTNAPTTKNPFSFLNFSAEEIGYIKFLESLETDKERKGALQSLKKHHAGEENWVKFFSLLEQENRLKKLFEKGNVRQLETATFKQAHQTALINLFLYKVFVEYYVPRFSPKSPLVGVNFFVEKRKALKEDLDYRIFVQSLKTEEKFKQLFQGIPEANLYSYIENLIRTEWVTSKHHNSKFLYRNQKGVKDVFSLAAKFVTLEGDKKRRFLTEHLLARWNSGHFPRREFGLNGQYLVEVLGEENRERLQRSLETGTGKTLTEQLRASKTFQEEAKQFSKQQWNDSFEKEAADLLDLKNFPVIKKSSRYKHFLEQLSPTIQKLFAPTLADASYNAQAIKKEVEDSFKKEAVETYVALKIPFHHLEKVLLGEVSVSLDPIASRIVSEYKKLSRKGEWALSSREAEELVTTRSLASATLFLSTGGLAGGLVKEFVKRTVLKRFLSAVSLHTVKQGSQAMMLGFRFFPILAGLTKKEIAAYLGASAAGLLAEAITFSLVSKTLESVFYNNYSYFTEKGLWARLSHDTIHTLIMLKGLAVVKALSKRAMVASFALPSHVFLGRNAFALLSNPFSQRTLNALTLAPELVYLGLFSMAEAYLKNDPVSFTVFKNALFHGAFTIAGIRLGSFALGLIIKLSPTPEEAQRLQLKAYEALTQNTKGLKNSLEKLQNLFSPENFSTVKEQISQTLKDLDKWNPLSKEEAVYKDALKKHLAEMLHNIAQRGKDLLAQIDQKISEQIQEILDIIQNTQTPLYATANSAPFSQNSNPAKSTLYFTQGTVGSKSAPSIFEFLFSKHKETLGLKGELQEKAERIKQELKGTRFDEKIKKEMSIQGDSEFKKNFIEWFLLSFAKDVGQQEGLRPWFKELFYTQEGVNFFSKNPDLCLEMLINITQFRETTAQERSQNPSLGYYKERAKTEKNIPYPKLNAEFMFKALLDFKKGKEKNRQIENATNQKLDSLLEQEKTLAREDIEEKISEIQRKLKRKEEAEEGKKETLKMLMSFYPKEFISYYNRQKKMATFVFDLENVQGQWTSYSKLEKTENGIDYKNYAQLEKDLDKKNSSWCLAGKGVAEENNFDSVYIFYSITEEGERTPRVCIAVYANGEIAEIRGRDYIRDVDVFQGFDDPIARSDTILDHLKKLQEKKIVSQSSENQERVKHLEKIKIIANVYERVYKNKKFNKAEMKKMTIEEIEALYSFQTQEGRESLEIINGKDSPLKGIGDDLNEGDIRVSKLREDLESHDDIIEAHKKIIKKNKGISFYEADARILQNEDLSNFVKKEGYLDASSVLKYGQNVKMPKGLRHLDLSSCKEIYDNTDLTDVVRERGILDLRSLEKMGKNVKLPENVQIILSPWGIHNIDVSQYAKKIDSLKVLTVLVSELSNSKYSSKKLMAKNFIPKGLRVLDVGYFSEFEEGIDFSENVIGGGVLRLRELENLSKKIKLPKKLSKLDLPKVNEVEENYDLTKNLQKEGKLILSNLKKYPKGLKVPFETLKDMIKTVEVFEEAVDLSHIAKEGEFLIFSKLKKYTKNLKLPKKLSGLSLNQVIEIEIGSDLSEYVKEGGTLELNGLRIFSKDYKIPRKLKRLELRKTHTLGEGVDLTEALLPEGIVEIDVLKIGNNVRFEYSKSLHHWDDLESIGDNVSFGTIPEKIKNKEIYWNKLTDVGNNVSFPKGYESFIFPSLKRTGKKLDFSGVLENGKLILTMNAEENASMQLYDFNSKDTILPKGLKLLYLELSNSSQPIKLELDLRKTIQKGGELYLIGVGGFIDLVKQLPKELKMLSVDSMDQMSQKDDFSKIVEVDGELHLPSIPAISGNEKFPEKLKILNLSSLTNIANPEIFFEKIKGKYKQLYLHVKIQKKYALILGKVGPTQSFSFVSERGIFSKSSSKLERELFPFLEKEKKSNEEED